MKLHVEDAPYEGFSKQTTAVLSKDAAAFEVPDHVTEPDVPFVNHLIFFEPGTDTFWVRRNRTDEPRGTALSSDQEFQDELAALGIPLPPQASSIEPGERLWSDPTTIWIAEETVSVDVAFSAPDRNRNGLTQIRTTLYTADTPPEPRDGVLYVATAADFDDRMREQGAHRLAFNEYRRDTGAFQKRTDPLAALFNIAGSFDLFRPATDAITAHIHPGMRPEGKPNNQLLFDIRTTRLQRAQA